MRFSSSILLSLLLPAGRGAVSAPPTIALFLFLPYVQINRAAHDHEAKHDCQNGFQFHVMRLLSQICEHPAGKNCVQPAGNALLKPLICFTVRHIFFPASEGQRWKAGRES
jgi:hypothetical protein